MPPEGRFVAGRLSLVTLREQLDVSCAYQPLFQTQSSLRSKAHTCAERTQLDHLVPHDLRRTGAKFATQRRRDRTDAVSAGTRIRSYYERYLRKRWLSARNFVEGNRVLRAESVTTVRVSDRCLPLWEQR